MSTPCSLRRGSTAGPPAIRVSLFARAMVFFFLIASTVGSSPAHPTIPSKENYSGEVIATTLIAAVCPTKKSIAYPFIVPIYVVLSVKLHTETQLANRSIKRYLTSISDSPYLTARAIKSGANNESQVLGKNFPRWCTSTTTGPCSIHTKWHAHLLPPCRHHHGRQQLRSLRHLR